jgi:septum formation protein
VSPSTEKANHAIDVRIECRPYHGPAPLHASARRRARRGVERADLPTLPLGRKRLPVQPALFPSVIVLGSASPRRRQILEQIRIEAIVCAGDVDESTSPDEEIDAYLERIVRAKLVSARNRVPGEARGRAHLLLAADTSVVDGRRILGKPRDADEARAMVAGLSGRTHEVRTRFALGAAFGPEIWHEQTVTTAVTFRALEPDEIDAYAATGEGQDKAGGYAAQGAAAAFVSRIEGSYTNVVGLPACELVAALRRIRAP